MLKQSATLNGSRCCRSRRARLEVVAHTAQHMCVCWHSSNDRENWAFRLRMFERCSGSVAPTKHAVATCVTLRPATSTTFAPRSPIYASWNGCWQRQSPDVLAQPHLSARFWISSMFKGENPGRGPRMTQRLDKTLPCAFLEDTDASELRTAPQDVGKRKVQIAFDYFRDPA